MSYSQSPIANRRFNSASSNPSLQGGAGVGSISPIAYSTARRSDMTVGAGENLAQMAAENPVMAMTNATNTGMSNGFYGGYTAMDYSGSANYGQYTGMFGGGSRMGVRGRQNIGPDNLNDTWLNWLALNWLPLNGSNYGTYDEATKTWYLDYDALRRAWEAFCDTWNEGMGKKPTWDEWLAWFMGSEGNPYMWDDGENQYGFSFVPVGDFMPLIVFALLYVVFVMYRRRQCKMINSSEDVE
jgi:hypothetical protein